MLDYLKLNPDSILNLKIEKDDIIENVLALVPDFDKTKQDWFNSFVKSIIWYATVREDETRIPGKITEEFEYREIEIFEIEINKYREYNDFYYLSNIFGRYMPKPLILMVKYQNKYRIIVNKAHENKKNPLFTVLDKTVITYWIYLDNMSKISKDIVSCLNIKKYKAENLFKLYSTLLNFLEKFERKNILLYAKPFTYLLSNFLNIGENDHEYLLEYITSVQNNC
jgi:hypothetical protein